MMTLAELLEDKVYREFFTTKPKMPSVHPSRLPWRVYVQRSSGGSWAKKDFHTYVEAFKFLKPRITSIHDATIQSRGVAFDPPVKIVKVVKGGKPVIDPTTKKPKIKRLVWAPVLPELEGRHEWCPYCRRPTVFAWFSRHHAFPKGYEIATPYQRCVICGASERLLRAWLR